MIDTTWMQGFGAIEHGKQISSYTLLQQWTEQHNAALADGCSCLCRIYRKRHSLKTCLHVTYHKMGFSYFARIVDHLDIWKTPDGYIATAHTYNTPTQIDHDFFAAHGIHMSVLPKDKSWYYPGHTYLVVFTPSHLA